jgi:hypothetical protein
MVAPDAHTPPHIALLPTPRMQGSTRQQTTPHLLQTTIAPQQCSLVKQHVQEHRDTVMMSGQGGGTLTATGQPPLPPPPLCPDVLACEHQDAL